MSNMVPQVLREVKKDSFVAWLKARGAEVLAPTNEWELIRFKARDTVSVVYKNAKGYLKWTGHAASAYKAFSHGLEWKNDAKVKRKSLSVKKRTLLDRDGSNCFFCCTPMSETDMTIEHLVPCAHAAQTISAICSLLTRSATGKPGI